jgi:branched-chain amino acid transport system permease protein
MTDFVEALVSAISVGSIYSLLAIALVVVYRSNRTLNFAQGEIGTFTTFLAFSLINRGWPLGLAAIASIVAGFVICAVVYYVLVRPLRQRPAWAIVLIGAGLYLGVNALSGSIWGTDPHSFPSIFPNAVSDYFTIAGARVYYYVGGDVAALIVLTCVVSLVVSKTSIGLQMRAVAANPQSADLLGISTARVRLVSWGIAGVLGSIAGLLTAPVTALSTQMMLDVLLYGLAAATLGGLDSLMGAAIGGIAVAVVTTMLSVYVSWIGPELTEAAAMAMIVAVLVLRPSGLFGTAQVQRV